MRIRSDQMESFAGASEQSFESRMLTHLKKCFPRECTVMGDPGTRNLIQHGIQRAATYGITSEREVCKYTDLMVVFGSDFDTDSQLPWASEILTGRQWRNGTERIEHLYETAKEKRRNGVKANGRS